MGLFLETQDPETQTSETFRLLTIATRLGAEVGIEPGGEAAKDGKFSLLLR
jgi:hypothetical protein